MVGFCAFIAGLLRPEMFFVVGGLALFAAGLIPMIVTSRNVEKSRRIHYMINLFLCGMFGFLRVMMIMMIITIPFAGFLKALSSNYREMVIVDSLGRTTGKAIVDDNYVGTDGKKYTPYDPY